MVKEDRRYRAPSLDREEPAEVVSRAHQFGLLDANETVRRIENLTAEFTGKLSAASEAAAGVPALHPLLFLREAVAVQIAADEAVASLMIRRASQSKGFQAHLKDRSTKTSKSLLDRLADALVLDSVRRTLTVEAGFDEATIELIVSALTLKATRTFLQLHGANRDVRAATPRAAPEKKRRGRPAKIAPKDEVQQPVSKPTASVAIPASDPVPVPVPVPVNDRNENRGKTDLERLLARFDSPTSV